MLNADGSLAQPVTSAIGFTSHSTVYSRAWSAFLEFNYDFTAKLHAIAGAVTAAAARPLPACDEEVLFYKAWDEYGALSNFSPHAIRMSHDGVTQEWLTVEVRL